MKHQLTTRAVEKSGMVSTENRQQDAMQTHFNSSQKKHRRGKKLSVLLSGDTDWKWKWAEGGHGH